MDLNAPLGLEPPPPGGRRRLVLSAAAVVMLGVVALGAYYLASADPHGGEPYAVATIPPAPAAKAPVQPAGADPTPTGSIAPAAPSENSVRVENGVKIISPSTPDRAAAASAPGPLVIDVSKALDGRARQASSSGGWKPPGTSAPQAARPRIAILVGGLGLSDGPTQAAIETLPAGVDLAVLPYGTTLATTVASAKAKGHEVLLQLPMQSAQGTMAGPHTLRGTATPAELAADLKWLTTQFDGYAGVTNLLGAPVTGNRAAMTAVLKGVAARGVPYVDDGTSRRSLAPELAASLGLPALQADVVLDATADPAVVAANLEKLATIARMKGSAIGTASAFSDHLGAIARFAGQLDARGFALVPVTALLRGGANVAANR